MSVESRTFENVFHDSVNRAMSHVDDAGGYLSIEDFLYYVMDYYMDSTHASGVINEPDNAKRTVKIRATEIWADEISGNKPVDDEDMIDLSEPLTEEELQHLEDALSDYTE